jgi:DNA polymerase III subunit epsilon
VLRSFDDPSTDDPSTPLHEVTFCVVDLETTGTSPGVCSITEVGAARYRGGELLGTFQTPVDAPSPVAPAVTALTGITDDALRGAPLIGSVLPALAEFVGGAVLVGHNLRFDVAFLDAALVARDRPAVGLRAVDTLPLARRLLHDEVPDHRLSTLAAHLHLGHQPTHRALDDALATAELLHALLEPAAGLGVTQLDDLIELPAVAAHPHAAKLRLTVGLPRAPGAYVLRDGQRAPLRVGHATDLRREIRALFSGAGPRGSRQLLGRVHAIDHVPAATAADAAALAAGLADDLAGDLLPRGRRRRVARTSDAAGLASAAC